MKISKSALIKLLEENIENEEIELKIGSGKREYPVEDIFISCLGSKLVFATSGYANWKRTKQMVY